MADQWNPEQYRKFADERARPFHDLLAMICPSHFDRAIDLGCGTGELTALAAETLKITHTLGLDNSASMLTEAGKLARPGLDFADGDLAQWTSSGDIDLVVANASLQWVPDHVAVLHRWTAALRLGGQLAVQVPANFDHASHLTAVEVASRPEFAEHLDAVAIEDPVAANVLRPDHYAEILFDLGYAEQSVRLQVYGPVMNNTVDVVEWMKGTSLTRFQKRLPAERFESFVNQYRKRLIEVIGDKSPYYFAFKRILIWGQLPFDELPT
jgi:trans-aconitate 2-methyltransferase